MLVNLSDKVITLAIEEELLVDEGGPAHLIDVETNEGMLSYRDQPTHY
jgi:hypothetical protein